MGRADTTAPFTSLRTLHAPGRHAYHALDTGGDSDLRSTLLIDHELRCIALARVVALAARATHIVLTCLHRLSAVELSHLLGTGGIRLLVRYLAAQLDLLKHVDRLLLQHDSLHIGSSTLRIVLEGEATLDEKRHVRAKLRIVESFLLRVHDLAKLLARG